MNEYSPQVYSTTPFTFFPLSHPHYIRNMLQVSQIKHATGNKLKIPMNRLYTCCIKCIYTNIQAKVRKYRSKLWYIGLRQKYKFQEFKIYIYIYTIHGQYTVSIEKLDRAQNPQEIQVAIFGCWVTTHFIFGHPLQ